MLLNLPKPKLQTQVQPKAVHVVVRKSPPAAHLLVESSKGTPHIGAHVTGGLIGNLDASLQNGLWHNLGLWSSVDGLSREEASEVGVSSLCCDLQLALQVGDPALHEVHIVQEHPATFLGVLVQNGFSWSFLTLRNNRSHVTLRCKHRNQPCLTQWVCIDCNMV